MYEFSEKPLTGASNPIVPGAAEKLYVARHRPPRNINAFCADDKEPRPFVARWALNWTKKDEIRTSISSQKPSKKYKEKRIIGKKKPESIRWLWHLVFIVAILESRKANRVLGIILVHRHPGDVIESLELKKDRRLEKTTCSSSPAVSAGLGHVVYSIPTLFISSESNLILGSSKWPPPRTWKNTPRKNWKNSVKRSRWNFFHFFFQSSDHQIIRWSFNHLSRKQTYCSFNSDSK